MKRFPFIALMVIALTARGRADETQTHIDTPRQAQTVLPNSQGSSVVFSPRGNMLATFGGNLTLDAPQALVRNRYGQVVASIRTQSFEVIAATFSANGSLLALVGDNIVEVWDIASGKRKATFPGHRSPFGSAACVVRFLDDQSNLVVAGQGRADLLAVGTGNGKAKQKKLPPLQHILPCPLCNGPVLAISPDGRLLAAGESDGTVKLWDVFSGELKVNKTPLFCRNSIRAIAFSPDGTTLATASDSGGIELWDVASGSIKQTLSTDFHPPCEMLMIQGRPLCLRPLVFGGGAADALAFSPDGVSLAVACVFGDVHIFDVNSGERTARIESDGFASCNSLAFSPDGRTLAGGWQFGRATLWELPAAEPKRKEKR